MKIETQADQWPTRCADAQPQPSSPVVGASALDAHLIYCLPPFADYNWHCEDYNTDTGHSHYFESPGEMSGVG